MHEGFKFGFEPLEAPPPTSTSTDDGALDKGSVMAGVNAWPREEDVPGFTIP